MTGRSSAFEAPWSFGDRVRLATKPEWGVGMVSRAEPSRVKGELEWAVTIRFPNAGIKTLNTVAAMLERIEDTTDEGAGEAAQAIAAADRVGDDELLGPAAKKRVEELMLGLPESCSDPFRSISARIEESLTLYRFNTSGRGLIDWAVAQTGLDDPLSRFSRHELEQHFTKWAGERDRHIARLVYDARGKGESVDHLLANVSEQIRKAIKHTRF